MNQISGPALAAGALVAASAFLGFSPQRANAQTVTISHVRTYENPNAPGSPPLDSLGFVQLDTSYTGQFDTNTSTSVEFYADAYIGSQTITLSGPGAPTGTFIAYCTDFTGLVDYVKDGTSNYSATLQPTSTLPTGNPSVAGDIRGGAVAWLYNNYSTTAITAIQSSALQIAIWEAMYDWNGTAFTAATMNGADVNLVDGNFRYIGTPDDSTYPDQPAAGPSQAVYDQANIYLAAWGGQTNSSAILLHTTDTATVHDPAYPDDPSKTKVVPRQDLIFNVTSGSAAPEPGTLGLLATALPMLGMVGVGMRRRRNNA